MKSWTAKETGKIAKMFFRIYAINVRKPTTTEYPVVSC